MTLRIRGWFCAGCVMGAVGLPMASMGGDLSVSSDFEGGSVASVEVDNATRTLRFMPGGDPARGWPCWWYFRVDGVEAKEQITFLLKGSDATVTIPGGPPTKPLAASWAMPEAATYAEDGVSWRHTEKGLREGDWMRYRVASSAGGSLWIAWGPPYTPGMAARFLKELAMTSPAAEATELCRSREGRAVPMLAVREGDRPSSGRFGVWIQARQHAWESGSSWVAQGFAEWLVRPSPEADWLRQNAEVFLVPIMDVDNTATGNGGKDARPQDHNRDWSPTPHWNEVVAAQQRVLGLAKEGRLDIFLDLHNPAPGDPTFFFILPDNLLQEPMVGLRRRFIDLAYDRISKIKPLVPMSNKPKETGASYHPLWKQISSNWVCFNGNPHTVSLCLETVWNAPSSTPEGYRSVGANLAAAVSAFLSERPQRR